MARSGRRREKPVSVRPRSRGRDWIHLPSVVRRSRGWSPAVVLALAFGALIAIGTVLLALPIARSEGGWTPFTVALFTATGAASGALVLVDTGTHWTLFGQVVILVLIQAGGLGIMTGSTLLLLLAGRQATLRERILIGEALGERGLGTVVQLARRILLMTAAIELVGAMLLAARFATETSLPQALWWGVFHSISAFNNAGYDVFGDFRSLTHYNQDVWVMGVFAVLIVLGGLGYTVLADLHRTRGWTRLTLDTKLVVATSIPLLVGGALLVFALERGNLATLGAMSLPTQLLNAGFHSVTARTAGFNSFDVGGMTEAALVTTIALMFIGGASGSAGGGIKVNTFSVLFFAIVSALRGSERVEAFRRQIPASLVLRAVSIALLAIALIYAVTVVLAASERQSFVALAFEVTSAFSSVGLSTGIVPSLSESGKLLLIVTMYVGRLGPLTVALALANRVEARRYQWAEEPVKVG